MRILLINPYAYDFTAYDLWLRPLGLYYLSSVIKKFTDVEVFFLDLLDRFAEEKNPKSNQVGCGKYRAEKVARPEVFKAVPRYYYRYGWSLNFFEQKLKDVPKPDFVFLTSLMTYWLEGVEFTIKIVKAVWPETKIVLGGIIPTLYFRPDDFIQADYFIAGYGERKILAFLAEQGAIINHFPNFTTIDQLPVYDFLHSDKRYAPLLTSRGCPFHCSYCVAHKLNPVFERRTIDSVINEIEFRYQKFQTTDFVLFDDAFLVKKKEFAFPFLKEVQRRFKGAVCFHTPNALHLREIDRETALLLRESNFKTIRLGLESVNASITGNKITPGEAIKGFKAIREAGFNRREVAAYILFGHPEQTFQQIADTIDFSAENKIVPLLATYSPIPLSDDFEKLLRKGINLSHPLLTNKTYFLYQHSKLSTEEIHYLKLKALKIGRTLKETD